MDKNKEQQLQGQVNRLERDLEYCRGCLETRDKYWASVREKRREADILLKDVRDVSVGTDWYHSRIDEYFNIVRDNNK